MEYPLSNRKLLLTVSGLGAEIVSLRTAGGMRIIWTGENAWPRHAPVCCPWCGVVEGGWFDCRGERISAAGAHGFVRDMEHRLISQSGDSLRFYLDWQPGDGWPWPFGLETEHRLSDEAVMTVCTVTNTGGEAMPLQFGFHPGLCCPFLPDTTPEDYLIRFDNGRTLFLDRGMFDGGSLRFLLPGKWIQLEHGESGKYIRVYTDSYPNALLWSKPGIPGFVCIEPWHGYPGPGHILEERPYTLLLQPGDSRSFIQKIEIEL